MTSGSWRSALRSAERERSRVDADLALVDDRLVVAVQVFDRVFDGDDVGRARAVDVVDHRGQRRALAAAGGAGDEHQAALFGGDFLQHRRQAELLDAAHAHRNDAQDHADGAALLEDVAAEAAEPGHAVGEVDLLRVLEPLAVRRRHDRRGHLDQILVIELAARRDRHELAVDARHREAADLEVQVGGALVDGAA